MQRFQELEKGSGCEHDDVFKNGEGFDDAGAIFLSWKNIKPKIKGFFGCK
jgi:hypothetical protein